MKKLGVLICAILLCTQINVISLQPTRYLKAVAHPGCGNILLTWCAVNDVQGYDIYRQDEGQSSFERIVQLNTEKLYYRDSKSILSGKIVKYYISAVDKDSKEVSKSPEMTSIPGCYDETECSTKLKFQVGNFMYWIGEKMDGPMNAAPEQTNGRVFLVIKYITSNIGVSLDWLASEKKATIKTKDKTIELWIGKNQARINGTMTKIDASNDKVAPYLSNGRTMLPMRFVGDNLGASEIKWDADAKTATIVMPKSCSEPDCNTLVVESYKNNTITGTNSAGFKIMFDRSLLGDKVIDIGDLVTVCGNFEFRDEGVFITARKQKKIENASGNWVKGTVVSTDTQKLSIKIKPCDGVEKAYSYSQDSRVGILPKSFPVSLFVVDGTVINWRYIENEKICQNDQVLSVDLSLTEVDCEKMFIKGEIIGSKPITQMTIMMPSNQWCELKPGACMKVEYFFDGLGNPVGSKYAETDCPCDFELITATDELRTTSGSDFKLEFKVKNTGKYDGKFEPYVEAENFPGKYSVSPKDDTIPPGKESYFKVEGSINDDFEGSAEFKIKVKCRNVVNEKVITVVANVPIFQVGTVSGASEVPTDENVNLSFDVTNYGDGPITVTAMIEKTDFPGKLTIEPITKEIPNKNSRAFTITGVWNPKVKPGTTYSITYSAVCGKISKSENTKVTAGVPGPIITLVDGKGDAKGLTFLDGSINWKHYTKSRVEIDWGDGKKEDVKDIPYLHTYKSKGEFTVKVTAYTKEGVNTTQNCSCYWEGPKPIPRITDKSYNYPTLTLKGEVDWNTLKPGKLKIDWADGKIEEKSGFPISHNFNSVGYYFITITAIAATGEEGSIPFLLILSSGLCSRNLVPRHGEALYH